MVPTAAWKTNSSIHNPYIYEMNGLKKFVVKYGDKEWPKKDGIEFNNIPDRRENYTDDDLEKLVWENYHHYHMIRSVWTPPYNVHKMAVTPKDYFRYFFVMAVDMTPMGLDSENSDTREPQHIGDVAIELHFREQIPAASPLMLLVIQETKNLLTISLPEFMVVTDY
jgi:hypothetical protein